MTARPDSDGIPEIPLYFPRSICRAQSRVLEKVAAGCLVSDLHKDLEGELVWYIGLTAKSTLLNAVSRVFALASAVFENRGRKVDQLAGRGHFWHFGAPLSRSASLVLGAQRHSSQAPAPSLVAAAHSHAPRITRERRHTHAQPAIDRRLAQARREGFDGCNA